MSNKLNQFLQVKVKTHLEAIARIREIQQDVVNGKMSIQEATVCIHEEEEISRSQLKAIRDFYELSVEEAEAPNS